LGTLTVITFPTGKVVAVVKPIVTVLTVFGNAEVTEKVTALICPPKAPDATEALTIS